jgi:hypothetical protein
MARAAAQDHRQHLDSSSDSSDGAVTGVGEAAEEENGTNVSLLLVSSAVFAWNHDRQKCKLCWERSQHHGHRHHGSSRSSSTNSSSSNINSSRNSNSTSSDSGGGSDNPDGAFVAAAQCGVRRVTP